MREAEPSSARRVLSGRHLRLAMAVAGVVSALGMMLGSRATSPWAVTGGAALFACVAVLVAGITLRQSLRWAGIASSAPLMPVYVGLLQSSRLAAISYAWGAIAMQGVYLTPFTGLRWQHGWQYAAAMALLAAATFAFGHTLSQPLPGEGTVAFQKQSRWALPLAIGQTAVAGGGLVALIVSQKLWSQRADWAANRVFAALAIAIAAVMLGSIIAQLRLRPSDRHA